MRIRNHVYLLETVTTTTTIAASSAATEKGKKTDSRKKNNLFVFMNATNQNDFVAFIKLFAICVLSLSSSPSFVGYVRISTYFNQGAQCIVGRVPIGSLSTVTVFNHHHPQPSHSYLVHAIFRDSIVGPFIAIVLQSLRIVL